MPRARHLAALLLVAALAACQPAAAGAPPTTVTPAQPAAAAAPSPSPSEHLSPEAQRWLAGVAEAERQRLTFLSAVAELAARFEASPLRPIAGCESSREHRPWGAPVWDRYYHDDPNHPDSTASGGVQMLDGTWRSWVAAYAPHLAGRWARAAHAPAFVQQHVALAAYEANGSTPWRASAGCWS